MSEQNINREVALRIALAARAIPEMSISKMLDILQEKISGDITPKSLKGITVAQLKMGMAGTDHEPDANLIDVDTTDLKRAVQILWGENESDAVPMPDATAEPLSKSIRVAIASNDSDLVNGHFGSCVRFLVYDLNNSETRLVDVRSTLGADSAEDKNAYRAELIADCDVLYLVSVGGPAAAKIIRAGIFPIKQKVVAPAPAVLARLQSVMASTPPPWLAKILGASPEERVRFTMDDIEDQTDLTLTAKATG